MKRTRPLTTEEMLTYVQGRRDTWMGISAVLALIIFVLLCHIFFY